VVDPIRYTAPLAEEDPNGTLIGIEAITELRKEIELVYQQSEEFFQASERLVRAVESTNQGKRVTAALENFKKVTTEE
jgi:hypothetical protein